MLILIFLFRINLQVPFDVRLANGTTELEGRVEVRHHGIWGTVCDDDFGNMAAALVCRSQGFGGPSTVKKNGFFGPGTGPIWLDEVWKALFPSAQLHPTLVFLFTKVFCHGNETNLHRCEHNHWGQHNCDHNEDVGVICSPGKVENYEVKYARKRKRKLDALN